MDSFNHFCSGLRSVVSVIAKMASLGWGAKQDRMQDGVGVKQDMGPGCNKRMTTRRYGVKTLVIASAEGNSGGGEEAISLDNF